VKFCKLLIVTAAIASLCLTSAALAQAPRANITTPKQAFGFNIGDDYHLANYVQLTDYWKKLASESDRMKLVEMGKTSEGRPQWMCIISSPENIKNLDHYRDISHKLALAKGLDDAQAHALAKEGKAVVWIDGGLHATEVSGSQQIIELVYEMNAYTTTSCSPFTTTPTAWTWSPTGITVNPSSKTAAPPACPASGAITPAMTITATSSCPT
jgi:hypothetical protein